jgi:deoxyribodipyrimidine photo-lyase
MSKEGQNGQEPENSMFIDRITELNDRKVQEGRYVLYWMQTSRRVQYNHALEYAIVRANELGLPPLVCFGLTADYPEAATRHYQFMLEGLAEVSESLAERGIAFTLRIGEPPGVVIDLAREAAVVVCDRGYLSHLREWREHVADVIKAPLLEVESELSVPVEAASTKQEYAARTIRPKLHRVLGKYLIPVDEQKPEKTLQDAPRGEDLSDIPALINKLAPSDNPGPVGTFFRGGAREAHRRLDRFIKDRLPDYEEQRSEPGLDVSSTLSPYLHFGQISELEIALELGALAFVAGLEEGRGQMKLKPGSVGMRTDDEQVASARDAYLEELIVRRGLAHNYTWYAREYWTYDALPDWARKTLSEHRGDERKWTYSREELLEGKTHDEFWNAAMREMIVTGYMHNYMRMYWGKKLLEWHEDPQEAFERTLELNNTWFLDGRDPNSYANVAWVFGLHDRPWTEREVFGKVRYMNDNGLKRKFDMDAYLNKVEKLAQQADG